MGYNAGAYSAISRTFSELNNLMIGHQRNMAAMESESKKFALQSQLQNEQIKDQLLARRMNQLKLNEMERMVTPQPFNMYALAPQGPITNKNIYNNKQVMEELRQVLDPNNQFGLQFSRADGQWRTKDGGIFQISPQRIAELSPALTGIVDRRVDGVAIATDNLMRLQAERDKISKGWNKPRGRNYRDFVTTMENADMKKDLAEIDGKIAKAQGALSPANQLEYYRNLRAMQQQRMAWAAGQGHEGMLNYFTKAHAEAADLEKIALKEYLDSVGDGQSKGQPVQKYAVQIVNGKVVPGAIMVLNVPKNIPAGMLPQTLDARLRTEDGWQWLEGAKALSDSSSDADKSGTLRVILDTYYGDFNDLGQFIKDKDIIEEREWAHRLAAADYEANKGQKNLLKIASDTKIHITTEYNKLKTFVNAIRADTKIPPEDKEQLVQKAVEMLSKESGMSLDFIKRKAGLNNG